MEGKNKMGYMPMPKLMIHMSLPLMFSLLIQSLYNIVDSIFVAKLGQDALAAISLAYPVQILIIAVAVGTSVGINSLLAKSIGAKDFRLTGNTATTGVLLSLLGTAVFMLLGLFCTDSFVNMFTSDPTLKDACAEYLHICLLFCLGTFIGTMFQRFLQSVGNTFGSMLTLLAGAVTNLVLDPLLIFGLMGFPALGVRGAAIATVIGQWVAAVYAVLLNHFRNPVVRPTWKGYKLERRILADIYRVGLPTIITQALGSLMVSAINAILMPISTTAVAFFGVYYKLQNFLFMPMNGLGQATIPIVGYNYGARQPERVQSAFRTAIPMAAGIALLATVLFCAIPGPLLGLFDANAEMLALGIPALRIISFTFVFAAVTMIAGYAASGLGNGFINMAGTGLRQVVLLVPLVWILAKLAGISFVWYAFWVAEPVAAIYAVCSSIHLLRKKGILASKQNQQR
ncbi:MATE family efflux transporter [Butyricicoccus sp.]|uniref:MATE family efflux transporter n=1 Tax=Butyricicoccus sp. TaxID=2049021 RepID=UPI003F139AE6